MKEDKAIQWRLLMRFGLGVLGLAPEEFWSMTPAEFEAAAEGRLGRFQDAKPMSKDELAALTTRFPDWERQK